MTDGIVLKKGGYTRQADLIGPRGPLPISRSTLWVWVREGRFPRPIKLGRRVVAWKNDEVIDFLARFDDQQVSIPSTRNEETR